MINTFCASAFNTDNGLCRYQCPDLKEHGCRSDNLPVNPELEWDFLLQNLYKSMVPGRIHPGILKELPGVITKHLSMTFEGCWKSGELPVYWKLANIVPIFKKCKRDDHGNYSLVNLISVPSKSMEKEVLGVTENHLKSNTVICHSQNGFMRGNSCLANLIYFYYKVTFPVSGCTRGANRCNPSVLQYLHKKLGPRTWRNT